MKTFVAAGIALGVLVATAAHAADARYPVRPVRIIVPQSAGGSTDLVARAVAQKLGEALKENVIVGRLIPAGTGSVVNRLKQIAAERDRETTHVEHDGSESVMPGLPESRPNVA